MSHLSKTTSCKTILAAISRTFKPTSSSWMNEAIEDIGWGIQAIGYHAGFVKKQTPPPYLTVANHRAKIPCDVERIRVVEKLTLSNQTSHVLNPDGTTPSPEELIVNGCTYIGVKLPLGSDETGYGLAEDNPRTTKITPVRDYYNLNSDFIITRFETGLIKLHYDGFDVDKEGLPRVIDDADYKMALQWYCVQNMILKGYRHPEVSYKDAFNFWELYRLRAENACKVQSIDAAERFTASWVRFAGNSQFSGNFFMHSEQSEQTR